MKLLTIDKFDDIQIYVQKNKGYGSALKEGLDIITTDFFCIINADGSMDPKYLKNVRGMSKSRFYFASRYLNEEAVMMMIL